MHVKLRVLYVTVDHVQRVRQYFSEANESRRISLETQFAYQVFIWLRAVEKANRKGKHAKNLYFTEAS